MAMNAGGNLDIDTMRQILLAIPDDDPDKVIWLGRLGERFLRRHDEVDCDEAISVFSDAVRLAPDGHPEKPGLLCNLGISLFERFERLGDIVDIEGSVTANNDAVQLTPEGHPEMPGFLSNLGNSLVFRFKKLGDIVDINKAISLHNDAVRLTPDGHPEKPDRLFGLGVSLKTRFDRLGDINDISKAISAHNDAVCQTPDGHSEKQGLLLTNLGAAFLLRFDRLGEIVDLNQAISTYNDVVRLTLDSSPEKPGRLHNLGYSLQLRFDRLGDIVDLNQAISAHDSAVQLTPDGHPKKPGYLYFLGDSVLARLKRVGDIVDIDKAISVYNDATRLTPDGHPLKPDFLNGLGYSLLARSERLEDVVDINNAISVQKDAVRLTPDGHSAKSVRLLNLGTSFIHRYQRLGDIVDIDKAISAFNDALKGTPDDHLSKPRLLSNLGVCYQLRFGRLGDVVDVDNAISVLNDAVRLTPDGHPSKLDYLSNLGNSLGARWKRFKSIVDVEKSIKLQEDALQLIPDDHPERPGLLCNFGNSLRNRFDHRGDITDISKAISAHNDVVRLTPDGHPEKPGYLLNLGDSLRIRFERFGDIVDFEKAVSPHDDVARLAPGGHLAKLGRLSDFAVSFVQRFKRVERVVDLDRAISALDDAVQLAPDDHPEKPGYLLSHGNSVWTRFERLHHRIDADKAILQFSSAARSSVGPTSMRFNAARRWAGCASKISVSTSLDAYSCALDLLPRVAWLGMPIAERHRELADIGKTVREAAAAAITSGKYNTALEWLEQGRAIVWGQVLQLRTPVDDLRAKHSVLAFRLQEISKELERSSTHDVEHSLQLSPEEIGQRNRKLATEWDALVEKARALPGFEGFLRPKTVSHLRDAARDGPVVVINVDETRCDALGLPSGRGDVIHIPLDDFSYDQAQALHKSFNTILSAKHLRTREARQTTPPRRWDDDARFKGLLSKLWLSVVKPVLDSLAYPISHRPDPPRLWWCPTGPLTFLPLHAAGLYNTEDPGSKIWDYVTSSYTPTLTALLHSPRVTSPDEFQILAIAQPSTPGETRLPMTKEELVRIRSHAGHIPVRSLEGTEATVARVVEGMKECGWVHLACHGTQDPINPTESALLLQDDKLKLMEVIKTPLPHADFAFLSACQTATGDEILSEESVHIAAGMLLAGYRGVIATTWSIRDDIAPLVADKVYARLLENHQPDRMRAAHALHRAVQQLRKRPGVSFLEWVPFIHIGM